MMKAIPLWAGILLVLFHVSCKSGKITGKDDGVIEVVFLQMNDVYEISPTASDNIGGLARVATLRKELLAKNPNTFTVLSGDFISPSVIGTLRYEGKRIRGKHMVEVLNTLGLDWVVFGNHEFDYDDLADLQARLDESKFAWFAANARLKPTTPTPSSGSASVVTVPFYKNMADGKKSDCPDNQVLNLKDADGTTLNLGVFGVLIDSGRKPWVQYSDYRQAAQKNYAELQPKSDVVVALTHLNIDDDKKLSAALPNVPLVMGGHDHDNMIFKIGTSTVAKADANAKTVYVHTLRYDKKRKTCTVRSVLRKIDASIADEPATAAVIAKWEKIKNESLTSSGFNATQPVIQLTAPLDCREGFIRHQPAPVGKMITDAMFAVSKNKPDCAIMNSGSVRVDDVLSGTLTELDIVRMLPFGGAIVEVDMRGSLLRRTLDTGRSNKGAGGYLQINRASTDASGKWLIGDKALDDSKLYRVALPDFLLTGNEMNMSYLKTSVENGKSSNPDIPTVWRPDAKDKTDLRNDIRLALIRYLQGE
jgi:5'-nucleotidase / UDP-sugar diphosphatase